MSPAPSWLRERVPLAGLTTLGVGGPARWFAEAHDEATLLEALAWARARGVPTAILGGGSNLLVADRGVEALVIRPRLRGVAQASAGDRVHLDVAAGEPWDELVARAVALGLAGLECLSGIPGEVGASPIQNIGAYGQEVSDTISSVRAVERASGAVVELPASALDFGYRDSIFKREADGRYVITAVRFALRPGGEAAVRYAELAQRLAEAGAGEAPSLAAVRAAVIALRRGKSMLFEPEAENGRSAGSFFTNVTLAPPAFAALEEAIAAAGVLGPGERVPRFGAPAGQVKVPAAWLIERAGFAKGAGEGRVGLSTRHTLAIVNRGGARAAEVIAFARRVRGAVLARFGVSLAPEPVLWGFSADELEGLLPAAAPRGS